MRLNRHMVKELNCIRQIIYDSFIKIQNFLASVMVRDDFSKETKRNIAGRVNYICSNPTCGNFTLKSNSTDPTKYDILGEAAHIKAASPKGPREDDHINQTERTHESNGIWLCKRCAHIIDREPEWATVPLLLCWKKEAELKTLNGSTDDNQKQLTLNDIDIAINELNSFIDEYQLNEFTQPLTGPISTNHIKYQLDRNYRYECDKLKEEFSSKMLHEYEKEVLPLLESVLNRCQLLLGEQDVNVTKAYKKIDISTISISESKEILRILYKLKSDIEWR